MLDSDTEKSSSPLRNAPRFFSHRSQNGHSENIHFSLSSNWTHFKGFRIIPLLLFSVGKTANRVNPPLLRDLRCQSELALMTRSPDCTTVLVVSPQLTCLNYRRLTTWVSFFGLVVLHSSLCQMGLIRQKLLLLLTPHCLKFSYLHPPPFFFFRLELCLPSKPPNPAWKPISLINILHNQAICSAHYIVQYIVFLYKKERDGREERERKRGAGTGKSWHTAWPTPLNLFSRFFISIHEL